MSFHLSKIPEQVYLSILRYGAFKQKARKSITRNMSTQGQHQQMAQQGPPVIYGIPLDGIDFETQNLIHKVMRAATAIFTTVTLLSIINILYGQPFWFVVGQILCAGAVLSCGYYGARDRNVSLLNTFTACNACSGVCQILLLLNLYGAYGREEDRCEACLKERGSETRNGTALYYCKDFDYAKDESDCDYTGHIFIETVVALLLASFYFYTCRLSSKLASRPVFVQHITGNPVNTISAHQQHGTVIQARVINVEGGGYPQQQGQPVVFQGNPQIVMAHQPRAVGANAIVQQNNQGKSTQAI